MDRPDKLERLAGLFLFFINHPGGLSFAKIREFMPLAYEGEKESARRKFERDKEELRRMGMELVHVAPGHPLPDGRIAADHIYIPQDEIRFLPEIHLTMEESTLLSSLLIRAIEEARETDPGLCERLESAASKLLYRNPTLLPEHFNSPSQSQRKGDRDENEAGSGVGGEAGPIALGGTMEILHGGIVKHQRLKFSYRDNAGQLSQPLVEARGLISYRGRWCLVARPTGGPKEAYRHYYVDRIQGPEMLRESFETDPDFSIRDYSLHPLALELEAEATECRLLLDPEREEMFDSFLSGLPDRARVHSEGNRRSFRTQNPRGLFSWMLRNPGVVLALGPETVRLRFIAHLDRMKELHRNPSTTRCGSRENQ